jgi:membrane associated rhomboid family serine protease
MKSSGGISSFWVFKLILINVIIYLFELVEIKFTGHHLLIDYFGLTPALVYQKGMIWQLCTYMFLHAPQNYLHLFFNAYIFFNLGLVLEQTWGAKKFLKYYFFCGIGAGVLIFFIGFLSGNVNVPTIGASGAIYGLLLAFGILYPNVEILLFFVLPVKAKYLVVLLGVTELFLELYGGPSSISHVGHLGGLLFGIFYFLVIERRRMGLHAKQQLVKKVRKVSGKKNSSSQVKHNKDHALEMKKNILQKISKGQGIKELSDDEFQYIKYLDIMHDRDITKVANKIEHIDLRKITDLEFLSYVKQHIDL